VTPQRAVKLSAGATTFRDGALAAAAAVFSNGATYIMYVAAAHALGPDRGGSFLAVVAAILLLSTVASVFGTSLTLDVSRLGAAGTELERVALVRSAGKWWLIASLAACAGALGFQRSLDAFFHVAAAPVAPLAVLALASNALLLLVRAVLAGLGKFDALFQSSCIEAVAKIAACAAIVTAPGLTVAVAALATSLGIAALGSLVFIGDLLRAPHRRPSRRIALLGSPALVWALGGLSLMTFADGIIARHALPARESGVYNAVALGGRALITVLAFLPSVVLAKVAREKDGDHSLALRVFGAVGLASAAAIAIFAVFPRFIIALVAGPAFESGAPLVAPYGLAAASLAMTTVVASYRIARGSAWIGSAVAVVAGGETAALLLYHPSAYGLVTVVICGHVAALLAASAGSIANRPRRTVAVS
jgi:O-antigen/teichoic acid export membrane protein